MKKLLSNFIATDAYAKMKIASGCPSFPQCGGCMFQDISYEDELALKNRFMLKKLIDADFMDESELRAIFEGTIPAPLTSETRNKMELTFGDEGVGSPVALGMRKKKSFYEVADASCCVLADGDFRLACDIILAYFRETKEAFFHRKNFTGSLRNLVIRKSFYTGEILVNLVTSDSLSSPLEPLVERLIHAPFKGKLAGILHTLNNALSDAVKVDSLSLLYGRDYIAENLLGMSFKITPFSFFQTNTPGAEKLYSTVREFAGELSGKTVFDLYCGTGTIAQIIAQKAKRAVGVEIVEEAVAAARENARVNGLGNCEFIAGDVKTVVKTLAYKPDIIVVDPPREGIHTKVLSDIAAFQADEIIYVSCNPTTLAADLKILTNSGYQINKLRGHDMFPRTGHVEAVVHMQRKDNLYRYF